MNHSTPLPLVNSWNEWDPLREIIVGVADRACFEPAEPGYRPALRDSDEPFPTGPKPAEMVDRANEQLDGLVRVLQGQGVTVRRPDALDLTRPLKTPTFEVANQYCVVCPRDVMITLGNEIVEATMSRRARYFEYQAYRKLVYSYWNADPRVAWTVAPKPSMADAMYREDFWEWPLEKRHAEMHNSEFCVTQDEVVFDAADMSRFGRDVLVQESMTTNRAGIHWLRRHLEPRGFRVHPVHFPLDFFPSHIDCTFVPLRPGLVLTNPERPLREGEERMFHDNGWELVEAPQPTSANDEMPRYCQSSKWLSMNVLSVSPSTVVCEEREKPLHDLLDKLGFEVLPVPFRDVFEYGGSLHCATWDVRREGTMEDYFPRLEYTPVAPAV
ncbi:glycine amidinotransferase [Streptomyces mobaraensis NBRC 13819 = DSM 40847]|uniref:Glycine amidinotransferase n=1 Tax=Streptomyces mobaraensis (strain ATCC 29032 / DSM 40847 / JCM 4168 / NBRC 13819 / NCIMB 11159 / IPCR 16-22) TaxID=1223523 RepID=M3ARW8_STRM1|nr:arginine deiminase family protein [Streptomyces mobaraensis]EME96307.1 Glycine amidinotransferase [Streptomyces mobaraensis NBRC 13819 = DSM 40847]QTT77452.1 glycine amidinotransferase [Streptomyces mobaraensis NBRC 13819 = DSM 40847]